MAFGSLDELTRFVEETKKTRFATPFPVREADAKLDTKSRANDEVRLVKHIHENCMIGGSELRIANILKLIHSVDGYVYGKNNGNPVSMLCNARYIVELAAFMTYLQVKLHNAKTDNQSSVSKRGESYYLYIQRAKMGATFRDVKDYIRSKVDVGKRELEPFRIGECLDVLAKIPTYERCYEDDYSFLSDVVHHSGLSHATVSEKVVSAVRTKKGYFDGYNLSRTHFTSTVYQWPLKESIALLAKKSDPIVLRYSTRAVDANNDLEPTTPFTSEELLKWTGTEHGLELRQSDPEELRPMRRSERPGRNEMCPCGSGKKYKHCCLGKQGD